MMPVTQKQDGGKHTVGNAKSHKEIIALLDSLKAVEYSKQSLDRIKKLNKLFGNISQEIDVILIGGTNGKSSTIHFASKLLKEESYKVGAAYSSHILTYNERLCCDFQSISNKTFTEIANEVISMAQTHKIEATSFEIMTIASLLHFKAEKVDVALFEVGLGGKYDATNIFNPKIAAVTRVALDHTDILGEELDQVTFEMLEIAKKDSWLISAEQSKIRLNKMKAWAEENSVKWAMPIRKLAALPYMYEQLYGRAASLGERIAQIYVEDIRKKFSPFLRGNLLATKKGQRGRPTLETKRNAELNPIKTLKKFWQDEFSLLHGRFQLLDKEKPSVLLDNADNLDAFTNLFLGIRLLHYQKPLKDLTLIIGLPTHVKSLEALKLIRYLLKKVTGQAFFVPIPGAPCHNASELGELAKELGMKAKSFATFAEAFNAAKENVDEREGLAIVTGHEKLVREYWNNRGIKNLK
jgi:dihydrofolate synthase/folylpolyglutamate synthase